MLAYSEILRLHFTLIFLLLAKCFGLSLGKRRDHTNYFITGNLPNSTFKQWQRQVSHLSYSNTINLTVNFDRQLFCKSILNTSFLSDVVQ